MQENTVKISVEIDGSTDLGQVMTNIQLVKNLVSDLDKGLDLDDLNELLVHNGLAAPIVAGYEH